MNLPNNSAVVDLDHYNELVQFRKNVESSDLIRTVLNYATSGYGHYSSSTKTVFYSDSEVLKEAKGINDALMEQIDFLSSRLSRSQMKEKELDKLMDRLREMSKWEFSQFKKTL